MRVMNEKKSITIIFMSMMLLVAIVSCAVLMGACSGKANKDVLYENEKYGFSLNLLGDFAAEIEIKEDGNIIYFVNKEIQAANPDQISGVVGRIEVYDKNESAKATMKQANEMYSLKYVGESDKYYFGRAHATDVQFAYETPKQLKEKYKAQEATFDEIIKSFEIM